MAAGRKMRVFAKPRWLIWISATVLWTLYLGTGQLASRPKTVDLQLRPGSFVNMSFFRLVSEQRPAWIEVKREPPATRPEREQDKPRFTEELTILISNAGADPIAYKAGPPSSFSDETIGRPLLPEPHLRSGMNQLQIGVAAVGAALSGELAQIVFDPPLALKWCHPALCWLGLGLVIWPLVLVAQLIWLIVLAVLAFRKA